MIHLGIRAHHRNNHDGSMNCSVDLLLKYRCSYRFTMVPGVHRVRVQLHDTYQSQHRHSGHDHGEERRSKYTDV